MTLFSQSWLATEPRGLVVYVHGLGDHSTRIEPVAQAMVDADFSVFSMDLVGHGRSPGKRGDAVYQDLLQDIVQLANQAQATAPQLPMFLYGQSLGGNMVLAVAASVSLKLAGVVASSPLFRPTTEPPAWKVHLARLLNRVWPSITFSTGIHGSDLSHDSDFARQYDVDPLVHDRVSARLGLQMFAAGEQLLQNPSSVNTEVLLLHGTGDPVTSCEASTLFAALMGEHCQFRTWEGWYHELHWETGRQEVIDVIIDWLIKRTGD